MIKKLGLLLCAIASGPAVAEDLGLALKLSTLGVGAELVKGISPSLSARVGINALSYDKSSTESDIAYNVDLKLRSVSALADWYPFQGGFRASAGLLYNGNKLSLHANPSSNVTIGNTVYTPAQIGSLDGKVDFKKVAPYIGIGWGNPADKAKTWGLVADVGVIYQQKPKAALSATCGAALSAAQCTQLQSDVAVERGQLEEAVADFKWYPVASVGLSYRF